MFNLQGILGDGTINEFKFGYNAAPTDIDGVGAGVNGIDFGDIVINLSGIGRQHRHRRPGREARASPCPGGLVRVNSAGNGRGAALRSVLADRSPTR